MFRAQETTLNRDRHRTVDPKAGVRLSLATPSFSRSDEREYILVSDPSELIGLPPEDIICQKDTIYRVLNCSIEPCRRKPIIREMCRFHYQRWRRYDGDVHHERPDLKTRLLRRVVQGEGCWEWQGGRDEYGYGVVRVKGRNMRAHRAMWEVTYGPITLGLFVLHSCDNPPCIRPDHLMLGTQRANIQDMLAKGRRPSRRAA